MKDVITVIVPVYNVAVYLESCLDSILKQDYRSLEVILIDDGSTDNSGMICDEYARKDERVKVIHQKNGGAASAKNAGLRIATGKYLSFVDSDDYLAPDAYFHMVGLLNEYGADVVQCAYRDIFKDVAVDHVTITETEEYVSNEYLERFTKDWTCGLLWDKLFVRALFKDIYFEEGHKIDDEYFTYRGIMNAQKIVRDGQIVYNYRKRRSSVMYSPESGKQIIKDRIDYLSKRRINVISRFPELREAFDRHFVEMMVILSRDSVATADVCALIRKQIKQYRWEKGHTPVDIRLWPALVKIGLGLCGRDKCCKSVESIDVNQYFD